MIPKSGNRFSDEIMLKCSPPGIRFRIDGNEENPGRRRLGVAFAVN
jgi:hypothetical protein